MRAIITSFVLTLIMGAQCLSGEKIPGSDFSYGNWTGAGYTDDYTGQFSHCVTSADYNSGDTLFLSVTDGPSVVIGVSNPELNFKEGASFQVGVFIDGRTRFNAHATAIKSDVFTVQIDDFDRALTAIQKGQTMRIEGRQFSGVYRLNGTYRALNSALECAVANLDYSAKKSSDRIGDTNATNPRVLYQLTSQIMIALGASDFRFFSEEEVYSFGFDGGVFGASNDLDIIAGAISIPDSLSSNLRDSDASDAAFLNRLCEGDFASKATKISEYQREISGYCVDESGDYQYSMIKTGSKAEVLYSILIFGPRATQQQSTVQKTSEVVAIVSANYSMKQK